MISFRKIESGYINIPTEAVYNFCNVVVEDVYAKLKKLYIAKGMNVTVDRAADAFMSRNYNLPITKYYPGYSVKDIKGNEIPIKFYVKTSEHSPKRYSVDPRHYEEPEEGSDISSRTLSMLESGGTMKGIRTIEITLAPYPVLTFLRNKKNLIDDIAKTLWHESAHVAQYEQEEKIKGLVAEICNKYPYSADSKMEDKDKSFIMNQLVNNFIHYKIKNNQGEWTDLEKAKNMDHRKKMAFIKNFISTDELWKRNFSYLTDDDKNSVLKNMFYFIDYFKVDRMSPLPDDITESERKQDEIHRWEDYLNQRIEFEANLSALVNEVKNMHKEEEFASVPQKDKMKYIMNLLNYNSEMWNTFKDRVKGSDKDFYLTEANKQRALKTIYEVLTGKYSAES
jgi:hypothetical protein